MALAQRSAIHGIIPTAQAAVTPSDATELTSPGTKGSGKQNCIALILNVTVAGNIVTEMHGNDADETCTQAFAVGTHLVPGHFRRVWSTGNTATFTASALFVE